jgi:hypothetical protein
MKLHVCSDDAVSKSVWFLCVLQLSHSKVGVSAMANKPPAGILPIYLRSAMVEQYGLIDETTKEPVVFKKIPKQTIIDDIVRQGVYNDFSEMRAKIQAIPLEELLFLHDPEGKYEGANFLICASEDIYQQRMQV